MCWNWLWDDRNDVPNANYVEYDGESDEITVYRKNAEAYLAEDAVDTLGLHRKLRRGFLRGPTPYLVTAISAQC